MPGAGSWGGTKGYSGNQGAVRRAPQYWGNVASSTREANILETLSNSDSTHCPPATTCAGVNSRSSALVSQIGQIIVGKPDVIRLAVACLLARGHLLIEDLPGVGKTTLSHALAGVFGFAFARIQFTSDLLPADILGVSIYEPKQAGGFVFHPGPIFAPLVLADEINRA